MKIICAWCKAHMGDVEPDGDGSVSHGICDPCFAYTVEERAVADDEYVQCMCHQADAKEGPLDIHYIGGKTYVFFEHWGWAFDCVLTPAQCYQNFQANIAYRLAGEDA